MDEPGILGKTGSVDEQERPVTMHQFRHFPQVLHAHRLPAGGVTGKGHDHQRDLFNGMTFENVLHLFQIHIPFERIFVRNIKSLTHTAVHSRSLPVFDMTLGGIEMTVARDDIPLFHQHREQDVLRGPPLMRGQEIFKPGDLPDGLLQMFIGGSPRIALIPLHQGSPLMMAHRSRARIGQQIDHHLVAPEIEHVVMGTTDPFFPLLTRAQPDGLRHLGLERLKIMLFHIFRSFILLKEY